MHEFVIDAFLDDDAAGCRATLTGGSECSPERTFKGQFHVGVIKDDHWIFAAEFERAVFKAFSGSCAYGSTDRTRPGKGNGPHLGMLQRRGPGFSSETGHDVDYTLGQASVDQRTDQVEGRKRRVLRRLDHASVATNYRGQEFPGRDCHGEVPW